MNNDSSYKYVRNADVKVPNINEILRNDALYNGNYDYNEDAADYASRHNGAKAVRLG